MYVPASFAETDTAKLHEFLRQHSFATLVSPGEAGLVASHLPLLLEEEKGPLGTIFGHMARANPHWRCAPADSLAIFTGPHAYVSPTWYQEEGTVPTWNYVAVHAYGRLELVDGRDALLEILKRSVATYEGVGPTAWQFDPRAPHVETMLRTIVGFQLEITRLEGKWKLSQNHSPERRLKVERNLAERSDPDSQAIAALMKQRRLG